MITVVTPVSVIPSHPDTAILDETIASVRHHLPDAEIILTFDGVRAEQEDRRGDYEEFIRRALWKADHQWGNVAPFIYDDHTHQVGMMRGVIDEIRTPLLMYVEADTPIVTDEPIDWDACIDVITAGEADVVRFSHESKILEVHEHMSLGRVGDFMRTCQWSQRPHLAAVAYYRRILDNHFSQQARCFIEDQMHGICHEAYKRDGIAGWYQHRIMIYHPAGGNIKRSYTTDGRASEPKWDDLQRF